MTISTPSAISRAARRHSAVPGAVFVTCAALATGACAGNAGATADGPAVMVTDSAGVELVHNGSTGSWGGAPVRMEETVRIGVVEGDEPYQFHQILDLGVAADGTIYVGNNQTATVRAFSPDGRFLREFGGRGQGPGEYNMVNRVWPTRAGVAITDWQAGGRTGVYDRDGNLQAFWTALQPGGSRVMPHAETPAGWFATHSGFTATA